MQQAKKAMGQITTHSKNAPDHISFWQNYPPDQITHSSDYSPRLVI